MTEPRPQDCRKIIRRQTGLTLARRKQRKSQTKAELRRAFLAHARNVVRHLATANRIPMVAEKISHIEAAIASLEFCLEQRGGHHLLRRQLSLCETLLFDLQTARPRSSTEVVKIVFDPELF
jgi:hypothetical protein